LIARRRWIVSVLAGLLVLGGCASGRKSVGKHPDGPHAAVYRARFEPGPGERTRKFRLLVFAADPDRLHGEIISPVGTTELILDAGNGQVSIYFVRDRVAYVGPADADVLDPLLGVAVGVEDFVQALLGKQPREDPERAQTWTIPSHGRPYPDTIRLQEGDRIFELRLKRLRPMRANPEALGTGRPPAGVEQRPLHDLDPDSIPGVETEEAALP
jgi:hypothetical protein